VDATLERLRAASLRPPTHPEPHGEPARPREAAQTTAPVRVAEGVATNLVTAAILYLTAQAGGLIAANTALTVVAAITTLGYALLGWRYWAVRRELGSGDLAADDPRAAYAGDSPEAQRTLEHARQMEARRFAVRIRSIRTFVVLASVVMAIGAAVAGLVILVLGL